MTGEEQIDDKLCMRRTMHVQPILENIYLSKISNISLKTRPESIFLGKQMQNVLFQSIYTYNYLNNSKTSRDYKHALRRQNLHATVLTNRTKMRCHCLSGLPKYV